MRIKGFVKTAEGHLEPHVLNDSTVVIDVHHLFYSMYKSSGLPFQFGIESDRFASYIKDYFEMFKRANVNCLFVIKGGHENEDMLNIHHVMKKKMRETNYVVGQNHGGVIVNPVMAKDIFLQTLKDMGFRYSVCCRNNIVEECSALARELSCPVISYNIRYCFFAETYIPLVPRKKFNFDKNNKLQCGIFTRDKFLKNYKITKEKMILFLLLCDTHIFEQEETFNSFMKELRLKSNFYINYKGLLKWLGSISEEDALKKIFKHLSEADRSKFLENKDDLRKMHLINKDAKSVAVMYFIDEMQVQIKKLDPLWFEKGVCLHYIDISYINLYYFKTLSANIFINSSEEDSSIFPQIDIIKYAYDLLTNFKGEKIIIRVEDKQAEIQDSSTTYELSIRKPEYVAETCVFENGWNDIKSIRLFEHFLTETLQLLNFDALNSAPEDSRMLLIALIYFSRKTSTDVTSEIYSIMLSYVMLGVVGEKVDLRNAEDPPDLEEQPTLDQTTDKNSVSAQDCEIAAAIMKEYFIISESELHDINDSDTLQPLIEFTGYLQELNRLNTLCGSSFLPTAYNKTYNGTFVYKVLYKMRGLDLDAKDFVARTLNAAPTVLAFVEGMIEVYNRIIYGY